MLTERLPRYGSFTSENRIGLWITKSFWWTFSVATNANKYWMQHVELGKKCQFLLHERKYTNCVDFCRVDSVMLLDEGFKMVSSDASDKMLKEALKIRWDRRKEPAYDNWGKYLSYFVLNYKYFFHLIQSSKRAIGSLSKMIWINMLIMVMMPLS